MSEYGVHLRLEWLTNWYDGCVARCLADLAFFLFRDSEGVYVP